MNFNSVYNCPVIPLGKIHNRAGNITVIEGETKLPFSIRRIYYLYDIPGGEGRGGHGHKNLYQLIVAASGSFNILLDDGANKKIITLNRPDYGVLVVPGIWRELFEFSSGAICLVLASEEYNAEDYIRDYDKFLSYKQ
ncbi:MAG: hypothetical protein ACD_77C00103G0036 [uncultured bacterium]|nr:MAG: hypothetical protein ACD_77C00103G0036 [uncultured bacterium]